MAMTATELQALILEGIPEHLPPKAVWDAQVSHAPKRQELLSVEEKKLALRNIERNIVHGKKCAEFLAYIFNADEVGIRLRGGHNINQT